MASGALVLVVDDSTTFGVEFGMEMEHPRGLVPPGRDVRACPLSNQGVVGREIGLRDEILGHAAAVPAERVDPFAARTSQ